MDAGRILGFLPTIVIYSKIFRKKLPPPTSGIILTKAPAIIIIIDALPGDPPEQPHLISWCPFSCVSILDIAQGLSALGVVFAVDSYHHRVVHMPEFFDCLIDLVDMLGHHHLWTA